MKKTELRVAYRQVGAQFKNDEGVLLTVVRDQHNEKCPDCHYHNYCMNESFKSAIAGKLHCNGAERSDETSVVYLSNKV